MNPDQYSSKPTIIRAIIKAKSRLNKKPIFRGNPGEAIIFLHHKVSLTDVFNPSVSRKTPLIFRNFWSILGHISKN